MNIRSLAFVVFAGALALFTASPALAQGQPADLAVSKTGPAVANTGSNASYDITVANLSANTATTVSLNDLLPPQMTLVSVQQNTGPIFTCTNMPVGMSVSVTCTISTFANGASANFTIVATVKPQTAPGTTMTNTATVTSFNDPNGANNTSTVTTTATPPSADLSVTKSGPASANAGTDVPFTITVTNNGPNAATTVSMQDVLPAGMTYVSIVQNSGPVFSCTNGTMGMNDFVNCTIATLANGASANFTLVGHIDPKTPAGTQLTNVATVTSDSDPTSENDSSAATVTTPPPPRADLSVTKNGPSTAAPNTNVTYTVTLTNGGPSPAATVNLSDTLPGTMTFVSAAQTGGATVFSCTTPMPGSGGTISCNAVTLPTGETDTFTIVGHIPAGTAVNTTYTNTATATTATQDPDPTFNTASTFLTVASADIGITKTAPATAVAGSNINYVITVTNNGPSVADSFSFQDVLPAGTTFVSLQGTGGSCSTPTPGTNGTVSCGFGTVASNQSFQYTITVHLSPTTSGTVSNTATVSSAADQNPMNDSATANTTVTQQADVAVTKSGPASVNAGTDATYTIAVTNNGPSAAQTVTLTDATPANTTFVSLTAPGGWNCTTPAVGGTGTINCSTPTLVPMAPANFTLVLHVAIATPVGSMISNTATIASPTDTTANNNSSTATTTVNAAPSADLSIVKTSNAPNGALPNQQITYTINVVNNGGATATNVTVNDVLPPNTTFFSASPSQGSCSGTTTVVCSLGTMNSGGGATISLVVTAGPAFGPVSNTATVSSANPDPNPANNSSTTIVNVVPTIPASSPLSLLLTAIALAAAGLFVMRMRS